jgi:hypothetical protein
MTLYTITVLCQKHRPLKLNFYFRIRGEGVVKRDNTAFMEAGLKGSPATINMADEGVAGVRKGFGLLEWGR